MEAKDGTVDDDESIMSWGLAVKSSYHMFLQPAHDVNFLSTFFLLSGGHFQLIPWAIVCADH